MFIDLAVFRSNQFAYEIQKALRTTTTNERPRTVD